VERTLQTLISERGDAFVGREAERGFLLGLLDDAGPAVAFVCGIAGVGKSALLRAFAADAQAAGATVLAVEGESTEPTEAGFLRALSGALGTDVESPAAATAALAARRGRVVLTVDAYERLGLLDDWLRRVLVPALPADARVVVAGRDAPLAAWSATYGDVLATLELDSLPPADAVELLRRRGVPSRRAARINRAVRGHPLSLQLAAATPSALTGEDATLAAQATSELARVYLDELDPATREALDAACVLRRVTVPLMDAMLGADRAADAFARVRALPFVTLGADGLVVHHVLREAVAAELRALDSPRHRRLRAAGWRRLRDELSAAGEADLWRYTADMLYLLDAPAVRDAFFPASAPRYGIEPARASDGEAIAAIARGYETPAGAAVLDAWWRAVPGAFFVARDADGSIAGFSALCEPGDLPVSLYERDPIAAGWRAHLRREPLGRGERALFIRFMAGLRGERPAPEVAALYLDLKRTYLVMRPALRRLYTCARDPAAMAPTLEPLGFAAFAQASGEDPFTSYCNDLGPGSVDGWLAGLAARDVLGPEGPALDPDARTITLDGAPISLTPLEFGVLRCLDERAGAVVRRETLLAEVWGASWDGDGNALEAVVSGLRRKLGAHAASVETVRGVGYRLRPLA